MRKVSIMVDVPDEVYNNLIEPFKKNKMLSKLLNALLMGYLSEDSVRGYIDDVLDGAHQQSLSEVEDMFENMQSSLANLGVYAKELKSTTKRGSDYFNNPESKPARESVSSQSEGVNSKEFKAVREDVSNLKNEVKEILSLVRSLAKNGVVLADETSEPDLKEVEIQEEEEDTSAEDKARADSVMSALLSGNGMSFGA